MKKTIYLLIASLAIVSCGQKKSESQAETVTEQPATRITVMQAQSQTVPQTEVYSSTVQAFAVNNIAPQSGNRIKKINVDIGSFVKKGQVLAEMDDVQLQQQKLQLRNVETELARLKQLYNQGGLSKSDYEAAELQYNVAKSAFKNLEENTILRSPINGVVTARNYDSGDMYLMAQPIFTVQQISPVKILVGVSETDYTKVRVGQKLSITADALPGKKFTGSINKIYPTMDAVSHTFKVEVTVPNNDRALRPGMYCKLILNFGNNNSVVVPDEAVVKQLGSGRHFVFILNGDGTVRLSAVTLGRHFDTNYEILDGIQPGDSIAVGGANALRDGSRVEIVER
ncbi:MAG: efflux RND transporter periplasmic adaptor subunit [Rikenellaceae bacterium]|jgi:membrane fusion protein (multidrug efflux system)|nr:efflux RND transporter periplasmic adaptor subunit [Rikenellaceae bacterium]